MTNIHFMKRKVYWWVIIIVIVVALIPIIYLSTQVYCTPTKPEQHYIVIPSAETLIIQNRMEAMRMSDLIDNDILQQAEREYERIESENE